ncbi:NDP-hexose 2,3-dehydratase family protein [Nocardiopsis valliformis]|uniref:NDP-hexose 2,3-dehydratase family protein n=1 Tax=Nocardiopsis valliformis TaxID=239974 RepID=UPI000349842C|nr:NDP-hexose 2,3-dehydratase family protein [Nocardiopsis valliformis]
MSTRRTPGPHGGRGNGSAASPDLASSAAASDGVLNSDEATRRRLVDRFGRAPMRVTRRPLEELEGWSLHADSGQIRHESGRFFSIGGVDVEMPGADVPRWTQPIIHQPETGVLGILVKRFAGVAHLLMQAKTEPGNRGGFQLSPTVQATRSNFTGVHRGRAVPYVDRFLNAAPERVIADVRQSEQGTWFVRKHNRNMVVEATDEVEVLDGFVWLTLGQVYRLLSEDNLVNMDARTVLACLLPSGPDPGALLCDGDGFREALVRSCLPGSRPLHGIDEILGWISCVRSMTEVSVTSVPLGDVRGWRWEDGRISHGLGRHFDVIGVRVRARGREVVGWDQPMFAARGVGTAAFLVARIRGLLHVLVRTRVEPGYADVAELGPTVQYGPVWEGRPEPPFFREVLGASADRIRFDTVLSEEGGRFFHTRNRYMIVEAAPGEVSAAPGFRWVTLHQLSELVRHSHYLNVEARTLMACLYSLVARP